MKVKTSAPKCVRVLSVVSLVLSILWVVGYVVCVLFQREIRPLFITNPAAIEYFHVPVAPIVENAVTLLFMLTTSILVLVFGQKKIWSNAFSITMLSVASLLYLTRGILGTVVSTVETTMLNRYGTAMIAAASTVNATLNYVSYFFSAAVICMIIALVILTYRCALDNKAAKNGGYLV